MERIEVLRGNIVLVDLEPVIGSEQGKIRPAVVVQNDILNKYSPTTIVAPITSKVYNKEYPTNVEIVAEDSGLHLDSTILLNQTRVVDKSRIKKKLGGLAPEIMRKVDLAIKVSIGLD